MMFWKKPLILILLLIGIQLHTLVAQTLNRQGVPTVGTEVRTVFVAAHNRVPGEAGTGKTWTFTNLQTLHQDTALWRDAKASTLSDAFPTSMLRSRQFSVGLYDFLPNEVKGLLPQDVFDDAFYEVRDNGLYLNGFGLQARRIPLANGDTLVFERQAITNENADLVIPFTLTEGIVRLDNLSKQTIKLRRVNGDKVQDNIRIVRTLRKNLHADGNGRIGTPFKVYNNVVRLKTELYEVDSVFIEQRGSAVTAPVNSLRVYETTHPLRYNWFSQSDFEVFGMLTTNEGIALKAWYPVNQLPVVRFKNFSVDVPENIGVFKVPVWLSRKSSNYVSVKYRTGNINPVAMPDVDFVPSVGTLYFAPNDTLAYIDIAILEDLEVEPMERFYIELYEPENADLGTINLFTVSIIDNDRPYVSFHRLDTLVRENSTVAYIPISLTYPIKEKITVNVRTEALTATPGVDFVPINTFFSIPAGETTFYFPVELIDDELLQDTNTFVLRITEVSDNAVIGLYEDITIGILDDDFRPNVRFYPQADGSNAITYAEATNEFGNTINLRVRLSYPVAKPVTFTVVAEGGNAVAGSDYRVLTPNVTFEPGDTNVIASLQVYNPVRIDSTRHFYVRIKDISANAQEGYITEYHITLLDNDLVSINRSMPTNTTIAVYPNPATDVLHIRSLIAEPISNATLIDGQGRTVILHVQNNNGIVTAPLQGVAAGIYTLQVTTDTASYNQKLIVR